MIGPQWLDAQDADGRRRLDNENDFVRIEIRQALARKIPVVPVLLDNTPMPAANALPADIRTLARRNAAFIHMRSMDDDLGRLIRQLGLVAAGRDKTQGTQPPPPTSSVVRPPWASDAGTDRFGVYADVAIPGSSAKFRMRLIEPGTFTMGSPYDEHGRFDCEGPQHQVTLTQGFWLADTPCTQAVYEAVMGENPSRFKGTNRPVE